MVKKKKQIIGGSLLGNSRETRGIRHFVATRSVKRSEASSLASGVCRLPFRRPRPSARRPFAHAAASLTQLPLFPRPPLWSHRVRHRAPHPAPHLRRAAPSRVALHLAPSLRRFPSPRLPPRAATLRARPRLSIPHSLRVPFHLIPSHPIPSDRPTTPVHALADISRRWTGNY